MFSHKIFGGEKQNWLIAFYGYGQSPAVYEGLYDIVQETHNILVLDNPMHEYTSDVQSLDFKNYLDAVLKQEGIESFNSLSYSMGSRLNLYLPIFYPEQIKRVILVAPDGIRINFWNRIAVHTWVGHSLFKLFVQTEGLYVGVLSLLYRFRILNKSLYAFSKWNMRNRKQRQSVYNAWMNMRFLAPGLKKVRASLVKNEISLISYFGSNDAVIPVRNYKKCKQVFPEGDHYLIDGEHDFMNKEFFTLISKELLK